jgi:soluble lytic murein transglycosylase-like protein
MSEHIYLITIFMLPVTAVLIFGMRFLAQIKQAKLRQQSDDDYRQLAERSIAAQAETSAALADLKNRIIVIEKILKEVE